MGMDINGRNPTGKCGEYFRNNVWCWPPLANYCNMIAPDICAPCRYWHTNDGDGLDAAGAVALAKALQKEIDAGRTGNLRAAISIRHGISEAKLAYSPTPTPRLRSTPALPSSRRIARRIGSRRVSITTTTPLATTQPPTERK